MRSVPFSAKHLLKLKVASQTGDNLMCLDMDNLFLKTAFSFVAIFGCRCGAKFEEINENYHKTKYRMLNDN